MINLIALFGLFSLIFMGCSKSEEDTSGTSSGLFENSFDNMTVYPDPLPQSYTRKNGTVAKDTTFPGQVVVLADGSATEITQLITQNKGTIAAQIPTVGLYLATLDAADVNAFLSALYQSALITDAFPNIILRGRGTLNECGSASVKGDQNSLIQTIDVSADMGCSDKVYHTDAVGAVAGAGGVSTHVNDITVFNPKTKNAGADSYKSMQKILELLNYAYEHNEPVIINISMGGDDNDETDNYWFHKRFCYLLEAAEMKNPHILDNAIILMSGANIKRNETDDYVQLKQNDFPGSPIWDHLYFVESQEGTNGCNLGYADNGTANVLSAPACHVQIPNSLCTRSGNSFSTPYIASLVGQTYEMLKQADIKMSIPEITAKLWTYQKENNGSLPTVAQLFSICAGNIGPDVKYDGTWSGKFNYTATIPDPKGGLPTIVNTSFTLTITLVSAAAVTGQPQMLTVTSVTCTDPTFGATSPITPTGSLSIAFLPIAYGSPSLQGLGINIEFPNGSHISSSNLVDGAFTIDANGRVLASTSLVANAAFIAGGQVDDSNLPGSGPGGYAYNWCTFTSWSLSR